MKEDDDVDEEMREFEEEVEQPMKSGRGNSTMEEMKREMKKR